MDLIDPSAVDFVTLAQAPLGQPVPVPVYREVLTDLETPISSLKKVCDFLLEHAEDRLLHEGVGIAAGPQPSAGHQERRYRGAFVLPITTPADRGL